MHIKRMQVVGFKSFADRQKLDFEPGMTAIVGPNGCGKSNIIDAFRWCLGEMSAKSLRSNLMLDVVFNGSGSRPPQNMAEVTLTFDNGDKRLPIDFTEVSITRRLFRSGESEYYINKTQCRLRDIRELFLDTGMGEDGYSSMEQGKVEWILQAKPEQRRELFEEAAGVSKYRARREEAMRKLDRVEIDLSRLNDIISVTRDQIRKLENAVNRAKTYERIRGELKTLEISDWLAQVDRTQEDLALYRSVIEEAEREAERLNTEAHQTEADLAEKRRRMTETEEHLLEANAALSTIEADIRIGDERLGNARRREQELNQQIANVEGNMQQEETRIRALEEQETSQIEALERFRAESSGVEVAFEEAKNRAEEALRRLEEKRTEIKTERDRILERTQERARVQQRIAQLTSDSSRAHARAESLQRDLARVEEEKERLDNLATELRQQAETLESQLAAKNGSLDELTARIVSLKEAEKASHARLLDNAEQIAKLKGQIHSIEEQQSQDPYLAGTKAVLDAALPGVYGPVGRLFQCDDADRDIVSAAIGENLGDLVAETLADAERAVEFLKSNAKGRGRIWVLERLSDAEGGGDLGGVPGGDRVFNRIRCEDRFRPLLRHLCADLWMQGSTVFGSALVNGGVDPSKWQTHVTVRLPELIQHLEQLETDRVRLKEEGERLTTDLAETVSRREGTVKETEELRIRAEMANEERQKVESRIGLLADERAAAQRQCDEANGEQTRARAAAEEEQQRFDELHRREQEDHMRLDIMQQELTDLQHQHSDANAAFSIRQEQYSSFKDKLRWHESVLVHTRNDKDGLLQSLQRHRDSIDRLRNEISNVKTSQNEAQSLIESSIEKRRTAADRCAEIQSVRVTLAEEVQTREAALSGTRSRLNAVQETLQTKKIEEASLRSREETLSQKLQDQYEMSLEDARREFQPERADVETLEKLRKRVSGMGPINLAAPQEHAELVEKNQFLTTQQEDLVKAKEDLRQVITKINATTREHFRETFDQVRANFRTIYSKLFRGGEADLRLTDEGDILSSGIDIFCQPPGKKLLHISLLSGGEKALTASALLFAFFQVRPSPVALLDEVDAPLDEANVVRFVEMVREFSEKTQFLIISHNKRTMEVANTLYGVTMEELGVSKVISARLQREKEKINEPVPVEAESAAG